MRIDLVTLYRDPGFTETGIERPRTLTTDTLEDLEIYKESNLHVPSSRMYSVLKLKTSYWRVRNAVLISLFPWDEEDDGFQLFGWVDDVIMLSDTYPALSVEVHFHIDPWLTYIRNAVFGPALITRRAASSSQPVPFQQVPSRYIETVDNQALQFWGENVGMVYIVYNADQGDISGTILLTFPVTLPGENLKNWPTDDSVVFGHPDAPITERKAVPGLGAVVNGSLDERLSLDPDRIVGVFVSPYPYKSTYIDQNMNIRCRDPYSAEFWEGDSGVGAWVIQLSDLSAYEAGDIVNPFIHPEYTRFAVCDNSGSIVAQLPEMMTATTVSCWVELDDGAMYNVLRFQNGNEDPRLAASKGFLIRIPLSPVPVTSNSWSSYVYSGARQHDIDSRNNQQDIQNTQRQLGIVSSTVTGLTTGAIGGGPMAILGAIGGLVGGAVSAVGERATDIAWRDTLQRTEDIYHASQAENIVTSGGSLAWLRKGWRQYHIIEMKPDSYSLGLWNQEVELYGLKVSEPVSQLVLPTTGPIQAQNVTVRGNIPPSAQRYIKQIIERGVKII